MNPLESFYKLMCALAPPHEIQSALIWGKEKASIIFKSALALNTGAEDYHLIKYYTARPMPTCLPSLLTLEQ